MEKEIKQIKEAIVALSGYCMMSDKIKEILGGKFCSIETCKDSEPHFHCSECQSKNGHHAQQCKYKVATTRTY